MNDRKKWIVPVVLCTALVVGVTIPLIIYAVKSNEPKDTAQTNITNENQQYANDNSLSLGFAIDPSAVAAEKVMLFLAETQLEKNIKDQILKQVLYQVNNQMSLLFGTAWMLDYKEGLNNLNTYYLLTNTHVLDLSVTFKGTVESASKKYQYQFDLPVNKENTDFVDLYLAQPQGNSDKNIAFNASYKKFKSDWFKTNIDSDNIANSVLQFANRKQNNDSIAFSFQWIDMNTNNNYQGSFTTDGRLTSINEQIKNNPNNFGLDSSILKLQLNPDEIKPNSNSASNAVRQQFKKIQKLFDISQPYVDKNSTYIAKLKRTKQDIEQQNDVNIAIDSQYFPFNIDDEKIALPLTVGGFPGDNDADHTFFRTATTNEYSFNKKIARNSIRVYNNGNFLYLKYGSNDTGFLRDVDLGHGSSGSMVLDSNNRIIGIYWGAYTNGSYGLFVPFTLNLPTLWERLKNYIVTNSEFSNSVLGRLLSYN